MTTPASPPKIRRRLVSATLRPKRLDAWVEEKVWQAVDAYASENGYSLSGAVNRLLIERLKLKPNKSPR